MQRIPSRGTVLFMRRNELQTAQTKIGPAVLETVLSSRSRRGGGFTGRINHSHLAAASTRQDFPRDNVPDCSALRFPTNIVRRNLIRNESQAARGNVRKIVKTSVRYSNETTKNILESGMANFTADIVLLLDSYSSPKRARGFYVKLIVLNRHTWTFESVRWFWWMWMTFIKIWKKRKELNYVV